MVDSRRIGVAFSGGASPSEIVDCVRLAESLGYESAWVAEGHGGDQFAVLAACAAQTSRILLGTSITSVFVRTAPTIAMAALTIDDLSGGRFILGVGSSHKVQVECEHGVPYAKPLGLCQFGWPEEAKLRRLSHPMDPRTVPLYVPREDRELVTNARCIADVDDKV